MAVEQHKALINRFNEELWNKGNSAIVDEVFAPDWEWHAAPGMPAGREGLKQMMAGFHAAFSNIRCTVDDQIAEGDKVAWRWTFRGTHRGELMGIPPTGREVAFTGTSIDRLSGGRFVERWDSPDMLGLMQQLGAIPTPGQG